MIRKGFWIDSSPAMKRITLEIGGAVLPSPGDEPSSPPKANNSHNWLTIWVELVQVSGNVSVKNPLKEKYLTYFQVIVHILWSKAWSF